MTWHVVPAGSLRITRRPARVPNARAPHLWTAAAVLVLTADRDTQTPQAICAAACSRYHHGLLTCLTCDPTLLSVLADVSPVLDQRPREGAFPSCAAVAAQTDVRPACVRPQDEVSGGKRSDLLVIERARTAA